MSQELGKKIKKFRKEKSLNQIALAKKADLSQSFLSGIESGQKSPTIRTLKKIAKALEVSIEELLESNHSHRVRESEYKKVSTVGKRKLEEQINNNIGKSYKEIIGHGPKSLKTRVLEDIVVIRIKPYSSSLIRYLVKSEDGKEVYKDLVSVIFENSRDKIIQILTRVTGVIVKEIYFDKKNIDPEIVVTILFEKSII